MAKVGAFVMFKCLLKGTFDGLNSFCFLAKLKYSKDNFCNPTSFPADKLDRCLTNSQPIFD